MPVHVRLPFYGRPIPSLKWEFKKVNTDEYLPLDDSRIIVDSNESVTTFIIEKLELDMSGRYQAIIENSSGTSQAGFIIKCLDGPSAPEDLKVDSVGCSSVRIQWKPPSNDGGSRILGYIVEKRDATKKAWTTAAKKLSRNDFKFENLQEGCRYYFRVMAENEYGVGIATATPNAVITAEGPTAPATFDVVEVTSTYVDLKWTKPDYNGGSEISSYEVLIQKKGSDKWSSLATLKSTAVNYRVKQVETGGAYRFRIRANNSAGPGDFNETKGVLCVDQTAAPAAVLDGMRTKLVVGKAGMSLVGRIPISGAPFPTVTWTMNGEPLAETSRLNTEVVDGVAFIRIADARLEDTGDYRMSLENKIGVLHVPVIVRVQDKPSAPVGPVMFSDVSFDSMTLKWDVPQYAGGSAVNNYTSSTCARTTVTLSGLVSLRTTPVPFSRSPS